MPDLRRPTPSFLAILALVAWIPPILGAGFSYDDREVLFDNPVVEGSLPWTAAFDRDYWHHRSDAGHYRPLATLSLRLDRSLYGENAAGYRWTNALLHASVVFLAALFWRRSGGRRSANALPVFGLLVFACHPLLADAVAWISGRTSMLSALGGLLGVHLALLARRLGGSRQILVAASGACAATLLAMLSKEDGFVFGLLCLWVLANHRRAFFGAAAGSLLGLSIAFFLRHQALGDALPSAPHAPLAQAELFERLRTGGLAFLEGLRLAILPLRYPPQYNVESLVPGLSSAAARSGLALLAWVLLTLCLFPLATLLLRFLPKPRPGAEAIQTVPHPAAASTGALFLALSVLPLMQIIPAGEIFAPRWAYLPLLFAAPLFSAALALIPRPKQRVLFSSLAILALLPLSWNRAGVYESRASFRHAVLAHRPGDAPSWNDLGIAFWEEGREADAIRAWERASRLDAGYSRPQTNLGNAAVERGDHEAAILHYRAAAKRGPAQPLAHLNLCNALRRAGELEASKLAAERAVALAPGMGATHRAQARTLHALGERTHALEALGKALALDPGDELSRKLKLLLEREMIGFPP